MDQSEHYPLLYPDRAYTSGSTHPKHLLDLVARTTKEIVPQASASSAIHITSYEHGIMIFRIEYQKDEVSTAQCEIATPDGKRLAQLIIPAPIFTDDPILHPSQFPKVAINKARLARLTDLFSEVQITRRQGTFMPSVAGSQTFNLLREHIQPGSLSHNKESTVAEYAGAFSTIGVLATQEPHFVDACHEATITLQRDRSDINLTDVTSKILLRTRTIEPQAEFSLDNFLAILRNLKEGSLGHTVEVHMTTMTRATHLPHEISKTPVIV